MTASRVEELGGRGVKEYSRRLDEFVLLGHRKNTTLCLME